ncbi:MAG TPA: hypothetical protein IAA63_07045 [Candidatus Pullilachnospira stercoravium]|uniref:YknX-like barrel-sandwich hybrid domain-containing protein n=1 Tax=Candidatus Pullilachnospira stercoravium TaxID=2840913 RepID=A0A9D1T5S0_9FIRM|nr:hypothetical protein [Candidatus Pullilachnospira stercoravium]
MKKKVITITAAAAAGTALLCGTVVFAVNTAGRKTVTVIPVSDLSGYYGSSGMNSTSGMITSDVSQNIYPAENQTVKEVFVQEGDIVKEGDPLVSFDMTMTSLELEMKRLDRQGIELNIEKAREDIKRLKNMKPASNAGTEDFPDIGGDFFDPGMMEEPDFPEEEEPQENEEPQAALAVLDSGALPYMGSGTLEDPYHFLLASGGMIQGNFLNAMAQQGCFFVIEVRQGDLSNGELVKIWGQQLTADQGTFDPEARYVLDLGIAADPEEIRNPNAVSHLTGDSVTGEKWCTGEGTADSPYIFLVTPDGTVAGSFFNRMREKGGYFRIEVREGNTYKGALMKAWEQGAGDLRELEEEAVYQVGLAVGEALPEEPEETPTPTPTETPTPTPSPTGEPTPAPTETPTPSPTEEPTETPTPTPSPTEEPTPTPTETPTPAPTQEPTPSPTQPPAATGEPEAQTEEAAADGAYVSAMKMVYQNSTVSSLRRTDTREDDTKSGTVGSMMDSVGLGADGTMTREEIQKQIQEREKAIRGYQLDLKEADLNIRSIEKTLENQTVKSTLNGVVKMVSDPENTSGQDPLVQVVSSEGLYIQGTLPENQLEQMQTGQILSGYCYDNGVSFTAQVKEISPYPQDGGGDPRNSQYPFTAYIEDAQGLSNNSYAELTFENMGTESGAITLEKAFVRSEEGQYYVMKEDEKGKLTKQPVQIARIVNGAYELAGGLTYEDKIAFPYGRQVTEGANCQDGTMEDLYR